MPSDALCAMTQQVRICQAGIFCPEGRRNAACCVGCELNKLVIVHCVTELCWLIAALTVFASIKKRAGLATTTTSAPPTMEPPGPARRIHVIARQLTSSASLGGAGARRQPCAPHRAQLQAAGSGVAARVERRPAVAALTAMCRGGGAWGRHLFGGVMPAQHTLVHPAAPPARARRSRGALLSHALVAAARVSVSVFSRRGGIMANSVSSCPNRTLLPW
jgi:hypothetical protein